MLFGRLKDRLPTPDETLPGRDERPFPVPEVHAVLGTPLEGPWPDGYEVIAFGMGCFWGAERIFWEIDGVHTTAAGYMGGSTPNPTYEEVCMGRTGHAEVVLVVYDPARVDVDTLLGAFWENHDPTQVNRQGNDLGTQYRSAIYTGGPEQLAAAASSRESYEKALADAGYAEIATEIRPAAEVGSFYYAEAYHQQYLHKNPAGYCNHGFCQAAYSGAG